MFIHDYSVVVLCDIRDTSILIVSTYVTIPVSPTSRYIAVYRSSKKYREMAQVSRVSTIPYGSYQWVTSSLQDCDAKTSIIKSLTVKHCASSSRSSLSTMHCLSLGSIVIKEGRDSSRTRTRTRPQISKTSVDFKCRST